MTKNIFSLRFRARDHGHYLDQCLDFVVAQFFLLSGLQEFCECRQSDHLRFRCVHARAIVDYTRSRDGVKDLFLLQITTRLVLVTVNGVVSR